MSNNKHKDNPVSQQQSVDEDTIHTLILYNDDYNSFDHVIKALVEVCGHDIVQAEQCAVIAHFKGSCEVKSGNYMILNSMCSGLVKRDLSSEIRS